MGSFFFFWPLGCETIFLFYLLFYSVFGFLWLSIFLLTFFFPHLRWTTSFLFSFFFTLAAVRCRCRRESRRKHSAWHFCAFVCIAMYVTGFTHDGNFFLAYILYVLYGLHLGSGG
jgi:predicted membrane metal-binding protein